MHGVDGNLQVLAVRLDAEGIQVERTACGSPALRQQPIELAHDFRVLLGERSLHHRHVVDLQRAVLLVPGGGRSLGIRKQRLDARIVRHLVAQDRSIELAREQHARKVLARRGAFEVWGIAKLGDVRLLKRHPLHFAQVEPVVLGQDAADPGHGRHGIGADADPLAGELSRGNSAAFRVVHDVGMLEPGDQHRGQQHQGLAVRERHKVGDDGELGEVELSLAHHALEGGARRLDVRVIQLDERRPQRAFPQRRGDWIVA